MGKPIEQEIFQKKFRNIYQKVVINLIYTSGWVQNNHLSIFKKYNITSTQYNFLRILRGSMPVPCSIKILKSRMLDKMSDVSRIADRLLKLGYVERSKNIADKRSVQISISNKGILLLDKMIQEENSFDKSGTNLSNEEAEQLSYLLDKLRD